MPVHRAPAKKPARERKKADERRQRERARRWIDDYRAAHGCADCPERDPRVLEFDHIHERGPKRGTILELILAGESMESVMAEVEKTDVTCSNCHRKRTLERRARQK